MNYVNRKLRDLWGGQPCFLAIPEICTGRAQAPCHSNDSQHGKGKSIKAHDVYAVPGCEACHRAIDSGKDLPRAERYRIWMDAWQRWVLVMFQTGLVTVAGEKPVAHSSYTPIPKIFPRSALR